MITCSFTIDSKLTAGAVAALGAILATYRATMVALVSDTLIILVPAELADACTAAVCRDILPAE